MSNVELSVKYASEHVTSWNSFGSYYDFCCDSQYYTEHKNELDRLLPKYGFSKFLLNRTSDNKKYYIPIIFRKVNGNT